MIKVEVTEADIAHGKVGDCKRCPIARAIVRTCNATRVEVWSGEVTWGRGRRNFSSLIPKKCDDFIERFDDRETGKPFTFVLRPEPFDV